MTGISSALSGASDCLFPGCDRRRWLVSRLRIFAVAVVATGMQPDSSRAELMTYHIGNSLTAQLLGPNWTARLADLSRVEGSNRISNQNDIRANQPLTSFVQTPVPAGSTATHYPTAFANNHFDALFIQPWYNATVRQEVASAAELVRQLRLNPANADTRVLVYATWGVHTETQSFLDTWVRTDQTLDSPYVPSARAVSLFMEELRKSVPSAELIPAGQVFYEIGDRLRNGQTLPGLPAFENLYADAVHPTNAGAYAACLATYTVLYGKSPIGLGYPAQMLDANWGYVLPTEGILPMQTLVNEVILVPEPGSSCIVPLAVATIGAAYGARRVLKRRRPRLEP